MPSRGNETEPRGDLPDSSFKYTPLQHVRVLFASFVQGLFHAAPVGTYHWEPSMEDSEIVITDENPINVEVVGRRPAITFTRGPVQFFSLGLDDMLHYEFDTGAKTKSVLIPGTMSINCCSRNDLESEKLAMIIAEQLWLHRELLMKEGFFEIGRQPMIGAPSPAGSIVAGDSAREWYVTTISCPFQFYRTSKVTPLNKKIVNNIQATIRSAISPIPTRPYEQGFIGNEVAKNIHECPPSSFAVDASDVYNRTPNPAEGFQQNLPLVPHPLNPAKRVVVRSATPNRPGLRPPSMGGRVLPISNLCVEESTPVTDTSTVKV